MKKVFSSTEDVIHAFAQKQQLEGRNGSGSIYFERPYNSDKEYGTHLYSYGRHYLLAEFISEDAIMINDEGYSSSTSKHINKTRWATRQYRQFYTKDTRIDLVYNQVITHKNSLSKAKKPELYIQPILSLWRTMNEFAEWNRARLKLTKKSYALYSDTRYKEIRKIVKALENNSEDYTAKLNALATKQAKARRISDKKAIVEKLEKFNNYEINSFRVGGEDFLRVSKDREKVETSQGVKVSVQSAAQLYQMIQAGIDIKGKRIDGYTVTSINGHLKIGCHNINMDSVRSVGEKVLKLVL